LNLIQNIATLLFYLDVMALSPQYIITRNHMISDGIPLSDIF